jgi:hypothetical protein
MDTQKFLNKYIASLAEQVKSLTMEKTMLATQLAMAQEELEEMKKKYEPTSSPSSENNQWQQ